MTLLIPAADWDGVDTCNTCHAPLAGAEYLCELCGENVCMDCRDEIGGMTHCPACAQLAREFINGGKVNCAGETVHTQANPRALPGDGQELLPWPE